MDNLNLYEMKGSTRSDKKEWLYRGSNMFKQSVCARHCTAKEFVERRRHLDHSQFLKLQLNVENINKHI